MKITFGNREKVLSLVLVVAIVWMGYFQIFYKGKRDILRELKDEIAYVNEKIKVIESEYPNVEKEKATVDNLKSRYGKLSKSLVKLESELFDEAEIPEILDTLMKNAKLARVDFHSAKPKEERYITAGGDVKKMEDIMADEKRAKKRNQEDAQIATQPLYKLLPIDLHFTASYDKAVQYIKSIEYISPYLKVSNLNLIIDQEKGAEPEVNILITMLLGKGRGGDKEGVKGAFASLEKLKKKIGLDPFSPTGMPLKKGDVPGFEISGIIYQGGQAYCLINDTLYAVGDKIDGKKIIKIDDDEVILHQSGKEYKILFSME